MPFENALTEAGIRLHRHERPGFASISYLSIASEHWGEMARHARDHDLRWAGVWADIENDEMRLYAMFVHPEGHLLCRTSLSGEKPVIPSHTSSYPVADRMERHVRDLWGIRFEQSEDERRWTRHQAWDEDEYPLTHEYDSIEKETKKTRAPADSAYPFSRIEGNSVYQIPVGPVHAGIIEPGHFRFHAVGETILQLEERLGYVHKGIEKIAIGRDVDSLLRLAGRVSGDSTVSHAWAAAMAIENALEMTLPDDIVKMRAILSERERIANHLGDVGAICNDVGFAFMQMQFSRLREEWQRTNHQQFGHRLLMDRVVPGGVCLDATPNPDILMKELEHIRSTVEELSVIIEDSPSLSDRLVGTGILKITDARELGVTGYVGKASGIDFDLRRQQPYPPYDAIEVPARIDTEGDVAARVRIRLGEIMDSLQLLERLYQALDVPSEWRIALPEISSELSGIGYVESWRGEIITFVRLDQQGRVARFFPRDPSWFLWPALERLIDGNIVPDFPVCNKSVNASYSGHDL
ncbi:MAG: Ni,Fe-hydrogenase III large subunit [Gammaproteobacteria bacterium]|nr:MAG: Ni,Fe-hydrogenase III large subunit [Gammaproteobacteria bacterium]